MQTRHPLSNIKTRAQASFRFIFQSFDFDLERPTYDSNDTAARDCDPVCVCNVKGREGWPLYGCRRGVWSECDCDDCRLKRGDL